MNIIPNKKRILLVFTSFTTCVMQVQWSVTKISTSTKQNLKLKKESTNNQPNSTEGQKCQKRKFEWVSD